MRLKHCMALLAALLSSITTWRGGQVQGQSGKRTIEGTSRQPVLVGLGLWSQEAAQVWLVGAYRPGHGWVDDQRARFLLHPGTRFTLYNLQGRRSELTVGPVQFGEEEEVGGYFAPVRNKLPGKNPLPGVLALAGTSHPVVPRLPRAQSLTNSLYKQVVSSLLRAKGLRIAQPHLTQHLRLDLNGDGVEEVLLSAQSRAAMGQEPRALQGDYALVALRFVSRGKVRTVPLEMEAYLRAKLEGAFAAGRYSILACPDINGDSRLEIAIATSYYEGWGVNIYAFDGKAVRRVVTAGWGV